MADVVERIHPCPTPPIEIEAIARVEVTAWALWWQSTEEARDEACADARAAAQRAAEEALRAYRFRCKEPCGERVVTANTVTFDPPRHFEQGALGVDRVKCIVTVHVAHARECARA